MSKDFDAIQAYQDALNTALKSAYEDGYKKGREDAFKEIKDKQIKELQKAEAEDAIENSDDPKKWICPECREERVGDERVEAGLKCGMCSYGCQS